ncbi:MAG TPA: PHP domain-containing protein [Myxococcaceae bacterium]|nr:PHP domain-containing protein [Myxococcaceae bacterium]
MIDLHTHTTASDGQHEPAELVRFARDAGITRLAITDHDTVNGLAEAFEAARGTGMEIIPGIELSSALGAKDIHILGHFVRPDDPALVASCAHQEGGRRRRMEKMVQRMNELGFPVRMEHVESVAGGSTNLCRPHLARAMVELGFCRHPQDAFDRFIGDGLPAFVAHERLEARDAIALVHAAGGTATLAHPGVDRIDRRQIAQLREMGLDGLEVFHSDHDPGMRERYLQIAREHGLVPTAGSDFHGERVAADRRLGTASMAVDQFLELRSRAGVRISF